MQPTYKHHFQHYFRHRFYWFRNKTIYTAWDAVDNYASGRDHPYPTSKPPNCLRGSNTEQVMFHSVGSHCPRINLASLGEAFEHTFPNFSKQAKCYVGVDVTQAFSQRCPRKFGNIERVHRNAWRISEKNRLARQSYQANNNAIVAGIERLSLSAMDVATTDNDCVHFGKNKPFNVYDAALSLVVSTAGRDCRLG